MLRPQQPSNNAISAELVELIRQICPLESPELLQQARPGPASRSSGVGATAAAAAGLSQQSMNRHVTANEVRLIHAWKSSFTLRPVCLPACLPELPP